MRAGALAAPVISRFAFHVSIVLTITVPIVGFILGAADIAKHSFVWLLPVGTGALSIATSLIGIVQSIRARQARGIWLGVAGIVLGVASIAVGWVGLFVGESQFHGPLL